MKGDGRPFLGVPGGAYPVVENPDGVFQGGAANLHSLYDRPVCLPIIPGDFDLAAEPPMYDTGR